MGLTGVEPEKITLANMAPVRSTRFGHDRDGVGRQAGEFLLGRSCSPAAPTSRRPASATLSIQPMLDYSRSSPARKPTDAIRQAAADLKLAAEYQARVRLTGAVPIADEEFATVKEGALVNGIGTIVIVLVILWLALQSGRIILAVFHRTWSSGSRSRPRSA